MLILTRRVHESITLVDSRTNKVIGTISLESVKDRRGQIGLELESHIRIIRTENAAAEIRKANSATGA